MKRLVIFSYCCSVLLGVLAVSNVLTWLESLQHNEIYANGWIHFVWFFPCITQFVYTFRTSTLLGLAEYKPSESLDDFAMNDMDLTDEIVQNNFWMKGFAMINSLFLCFLFLSVFPNLPGTLSRLFEPDEPVQQVRLFASVFITFLAIPTIIYNLRSFNISRVRKVIVE